MTFSNKKTRIQPSPEKPSRPTISNEETSQNPSGQTISTRKMIPQTSKNKSNTSTYLKKNFLNKKKKRQSAKKKYIIPIVQRPSKSKSVLVEGTIDYKNIFLLRQFITVQGKIVPRRISKLTAKQQRHISKAIKNARMVGLLPFIQKSQTSL